MGKILWKSPNKKWEIYEDSLKSKTNWDDGYDTVARVEVTDGWSVAYASIDVSGRIGTGDFMTNWEYFVPKTVESKSFSLLRAIYKAKKQKQQGNGQLPLQYAVIVSVVGTSKGVKGPSPTFYRTYDTAIKHAENEWKKLSPYQRSNGAFVNVGRLNKAYATAKEIPERFGYSLLRTVNGSYFNQNKRRK